MCEHTELRAYPVLSCVVCGERLCEEFNGSTYSGWHVWIHRNLPQASRLACVSCGGQAYQWAYTHTCTDQRGPMPWCPHPDHYVPMCVPCHRKMDINNRGPVTTPYPRDEQGRCINKDGSVRKPWTRSSP